MITPDMITALAKNPKQRYQYNWSDEVIWEALNAHGSIQCVYGKGKATARTDFLTLDAKTMTLDWTLVPQPVPWQEALQATINGKAIKVECPDCSGGDPDSCILKHHKTDSICVSALKEGAFYILEDGSID